MHFGSTSVRQVTRNVPLRGAVCGLMLVLFMALQAMLSFAESAPLEARDFKMAGDATRMRVVLNFDGEPNPEWLLLRAPHRLVLDLPETKLLLHPDGLKAIGLVTDVRYGHLQEGKSRLILTSKGPFTVERLDVLENEGESGYRLVVDLVAASDRQFEEALALQSQTTGATVATPKGDRLGKAPADDVTRPFTIVIDPGHGGIDGGAKGTSGTEEKTITLAFALELKAKLASSGKYDVYLTREKDEFLRLDDRVRIARQHEADLFISIHADTIRLKGIRGATVYTVSDKASDEEAEALAIRENLSDQLAGMEIEGEKQEVADILVDLIRRETHSFSIRFARSLVSELSNTVGLINNPHRFAGFKVLKAPDVPSVLVELGYMSNPKDEAQLRDPDWRGKAAASISNAIAAFAASRSAGG
ncbi:N-acetylmuramoyl-L-alanine amidase [Mesorhizobium sp. WSM2239]|uniref:N-acetylmuramoyl-L-alanine amidase n=2 Tax=unclassified Mesorhizobium TaxID=325217 RepID=A0AAU8D3D5_9HYPH